MSTAKSGVRKKQKEPPAPEKIGKYLITRLVGEGGMGRVYRGIDPDTRATVAVKTILEERLTSPAALPRFLREMQILAGLDHPHIVKIRDRGLFEGGHFLVMDFVDGKPLDEVIRDGPPPTREVGLGWACEIADALRYMHGARVMHRDLKPGNIIAKVEGGLTIIDFGLSRFLEPGGTVTGVGRVIGSPHYLPPEQWRGERPDERADIYQFGILFLELLTGKVPFSGTDLRAIMDSCLNYGVTARVLHDMGVEGDIAEFALRLTARAKEERYQDMVQVLDDLRRLEKKHPLSPMPDPPTAIGGRVGSELEDSLDFDDSSSEVDLDAPTSEDPPQRDPRLAGSFWKPPEPAGPPAVPPPGALDETIPVVRGVVPMAVPAPAPRFPVAALLAGAALAFLCVGVVALATRTPPPEPRPKVIDGPRVVDGVAAARVEWETDLPCLGKVSVRGGGQARVVVDEDGVRRAHAVTIVDLEPGERYEFMVEDADGPLSPALPFTARGVSVAFQPFFSRKGIELHWTSEDPLILKEGKDPKVGRPEGEYPRKEGSLFLMGIRPGAGRVTVLAFAPLGSVMPVVWTVPEVETLATGVEDALEDATRGESAARFRAALAEGSAIRAAAGLREALERAARPQPASRLMVQASLALDDANLGLGRRSALLDALGRLRLQARELKLEGADLGVPLGEAQSERFGWGARHTVRRPQGTLISELVLPPAPLLAGPPGDTPADPRSVVVWRPNLTARPTSGSVTLVAHCMHLSPALYLEARLGAARALLMNEPEIYRLEGNDVDDGWSMVHHSFDAGLLSLEGGEIRIELRSLRAAFTGRAVPVQRFELYDGRPEF